MIAECAPRAFGDAILSRSIYAITQNSAEFPRPAPFRAGLTALMYASKSGQKDVVRLLVEQGADITKTWKNKTPLQIAREVNHPEIIHLLELAAQE